MSFHVVILPRAESDIEANARWWAEHHDVAQAIRWFDAIHDQIQSLSECPECHSLSAENGDFACVIRDQLIGLGSRPSYRAVFTIKDQTVYVLTVRRSAQSTFRPEPIEFPE